MRSSFRDSDVFARLGGDEFVALLTDTDQQNVASALERFKQGIDAYNQQAKRGYDLKYSVGHVTYDANKYASIEELLSAADALMYEQKKIRKKQ